MKRWWVAVLFVLACSDTKTKPAEAEQESPYEAEARAIREKFRVVIADFHADVVAGRIEAAYDRLAPMYRVGVPLDRFAAAAKHPFFKEGVKFTVRKTSEGGGTAKVSVWMEGPLGASQVDLRCTAVDGVYKIAGLSVDGQSVLPAP
jgi:hypothetical protein